MALILALSLVAACALPASVASEKTSIFAAKYVAHRGYSALYPQNTVLAFEKAVEAGFWGIECDIHTTSDGKWVVIHDGEIFDLTNGEGEISEMTFEQLSQYKVDAGNGIENYGTLPIPTLEQYLDVCKTSDIVPVIEIKGWEDQYLPSLKTMLAEYGLSERAVIISFSASALEKYRELDKDATIYYLMNDPTFDDVKFCVANNFGLNTNFGGFLKCYYSIVYAKLCGVPVATWTVDNGFLAFLLRIMGAEIITSNTLH